MTGTEGDFEKLAYEAALRGLDKQEQLLEELRARTGLLLAAASIAAPSLGQRALEGSHPRGLALIALTAFAILIGASVFVLIPRKDLAFAESGASQYERLYSLRDDMAEVYRCLAFAMDDFWWSNDRRIAQMIRACAVAATALAVEIFCLVTMLGDGAF